VRPPEHATRNDKAGRAPKPARSVLTRRTYRRRRVVAGIAGTLFVFLTLFSVSFVSVLVNPSYGVSISTRAAEWFRDHGLGSAVTFFEEEWYKLHPPKVGGTPPSSAFRASTPVRVREIPEALRTPRRLRSPAGAWLPGEGVWHPAGRSVDGVPAIFTTSVRPDALHTSYVVGVAWMDTRLLRAQLYAGSEIPGGGPYPYEAPISPFASRSLDAAFNSGFRMQDANGGYYIDHKTIVPLHGGAASFVVYRDGSATIGAWGTQVKMSSDVASVRQNLDLIVNDGKPVPGLIANDNSQWGATLGGAYYVWRSGIGVTRSGALIYVGGPSLAITSLADLLVDAGAVRAMELDINTDWVQFSSYMGRPNTIVTGSNGTSLLPSMVGTSWRFFESWWIRDFYTMSVRRQPDPRPEAPLP
jgi:hypothetical protein